MTTSLYLQPIQSRRHQPSAFEDELADAIEAAFAAGVTELEPLVAAINELGSRQQDGREWTADDFVAAIHQLGAAE